MKNLIKLLVIVVGIGLISCNKDNKQTVSNPPNTVVATISGVVFNTNHYPMSNVKVKIGNTEQITGIDGGFVFENVGVSDDRYKVEFEKDGYFETFRSGKTKANEVTKIQATMVATDLSESTTYSLTFDPSLGGIIYYSTDTLLYFPPNLSYVYENGASYTGNINVFVKYVDASLPEYSKIIPGGDQFGRYPSSSTNYYLYSYSGIMVALFDNNNNKIDLSSSNTSKVRIGIPIPVSMASTSPDTTGLWYGGGDLAYASNKGSSKKVGGRYTAAVGHFSVWNMQDKSEAFGTISGQVVDCNGEPVNGIRVQIGQTYTITDNNGKYSAIVPAGIDNIIVQVLAEDYFGNSSTPITLSALTSGELRSDIDISLACMGTVTGRLVNCSGIPVPGQVVIYDGTANVAKTYTKDGNFELKYNLSSTYYTIYCKGYNYSTILNVNGATYPNNVGDITLCPPSYPPAGANKVVIDNNSYEFNSSAYGHYSASAFSISALNGSDDMSLNIENCVGVGTYAVSGINKSINSYASFYIEGVSYMLHSGTIYITTFDDVGGRVKGNFVGTGSNGEAITGTFDVQRSDDM